MKDHILDTDFDLSFVGGDFEVKDAQAQAINLLLITGQGHWKSSPNTGIALEQYINSNDQVTAISQIRYGLQTDLATVNKIKLDNGLEIDAVWNI